MRDEKKKAAETAVDTMRERPKLIKEYTVMALKNTKRANRNQKAIKIGV